MSATLPFITVVGAGGIGCAVAYALRRAGVDLDMVDADADKVRWGRQHGVAIAGHSSLPITIHDFADWQPRPGTLVLLCTKCYDNTAVLARIPASMEVVPIQNGFDPQLADRPGWEGIASFVSECVPGQTQTRITRKGKLHLGPRGSARYPLIDVFAQKLKSGLFKVVQVDDILPYKFTKLLYNAAISPIAAAGGLDNGRLLMHPTARALFFGLLRENYAILHGAGLTLATIGPFHPATVQKILARPWIVRMLAWAFYPTLRGAYCSMFNDLPRGRTEIAYYNGHLVRLAADRPCELNCRIVTLIERMEKDRVAPSIQVLEDFALRFRQR